VSCLKKANIKPKIMGELTQVGHLPEQQAFYVKWSKGRGDGAWFSKRVIRTTTNKEASEIVRGIAGAPNGSVSEAQQGKYDSWYTDGYRGGDTATIYKG
jgi:hypothetical protein